MTNNVTPEMTIELLEEAGVNTTVIFFLKKNPTLLYEKIKEIIGTDFAPEVSHFKSQYIQKIKEGNDSFKILGNGDLWISKFKIIENKSFNDGLFRDPANDKYKNITENITLTSNEEQVVRRTITYKGFVQNGQYYFDGSILQENFDNNNNLLDGIEGRWENSQSMSLPPNIYTFSFVYNPFTHTKETQMDGHYINTNNPEWQLTSTGEFSKLDSQHTEFPNNDKPIISRFKLVNDKPIISRLKLINDKAHQFLRAKLPSSKQELTDYSDTNQQGSYNAYNSKTR